MTLAAIFLRHLPDARRAHFEGSADLEDAITALAETGRTAWPEIALEDADFSAFLGRCVPDGEAEDLKALRSDELWLVCAYGRGIPGAAEVLERLYFDREAAALARLGAPPTMIADVLQEIRLRLVESQAKDASRKAYSGRGSLGGWLRTAAVRTMNRHRGRRARDVMSGTGPLQVALPTDEPETALLMKTYKRELSEAFQEALLSMSPRERTLLRYRFAEGLSIDRVGALYQVHRATAARWIESARETLSERTRASFQSRISLSDESFQRIVGLIESTLGAAIAGPL